MPENETTTGQYDRQNVPSPEKIEAALKIAETLPRATETENIPQFGNNFYLLFTARHRESKGLTPAGSAIKKIYLDRAEALGQPWRRFLSENSQLLTEIDEALEQEEKYHLLLQIFTKFYQARDFEGGDAFDKKVDSKLGIDAVRISVWKRLNSLLEQAAEAMRKVGIEPEQFYG